MVRSMPYPHVRWPPRRRHAPPPRAMLAHAAGPSMLSPPPTRAPLARPASRSRRNPTQPVVNTYERSSFFANLLSNYVVVHRNFAVLQRVYRRNVFARGDFFNRQCVDHTQVDLQERLRKCNY
jgi:hypothetical protein